MDYLVSYGEWLRERREALRLTRPELADCAGCSVSALRKIEADERRPSRELAELLGRCLNIPAERQLVFVEAARGLRPVARLGRPAPQPVPQQPPPAVAADVPTRSLAASPLWNLPAPATPLLGRETELATLAQLLSDPDCRLLTVVGPGGIGKTRLAIEAACYNWERFAHGVFFIPLATASSPELIVPGIAQAVGLNFSGPAEPRSQLANFLRRKQVLLLLDNLEHLLAGVEELTALLSDAPHLKLFVTSRERLELQVEWVFELQGLPVPSEGEAEVIEKYSSFQLFVQRARQARIDFELSAENRTHVARICRLVEGMPLAIELAAAWVHVLSCREIADEIERGIDFLTTTMRDMPERQRSIRAVFDHSWQLLNAEGQQVLRRLSVFCGGFTRQAAEVVAGAELPVLSALVAKSFLRRTPAGRYDLHELIRWYAGSRLAEDPQELATLQERHSLFYLTLLEEEGLKLQSSRQKETVAKLLSEMDNVRSAWDWSIAARQFLPLYRVSPRLMHLLEVLNWFKEGEVTFRKTADALQAIDSGTELDAPHQVALYAMLAHYGFFLLRMGRGAEAHSVLSPSAQYLRTAYLQTGTDPLPTIYSLSYFGIDCWILGKFSEAKESLEESLALARRYGERWYEAMIGEFLWMLAIDQGEHKQAQQYLTEALAILRPLGDPNEMALLLSYSGRMMLISGEWGEAEKQLRESLELAREIDYRYPICLALDGLGQVAYAQERYEDARAFFSESTELAREMGAHYRLSRILTHHGFNSMALSEEGEAQDAFKTALRMAYEGGWMPVTLQALLGLATLEASQKASKDILKLALYTLQHPASSHETKNLAGRLRLELESRLSQAEVEDAREAAVRFGLGELVREFLPGD